MIKKILVFILIIILVTIVSSLLYYLSQKNAPPEGQNRGMRSVSVMVAPVVLDVFTESIEALGTTKANESLDLTATTTDKISKINFTDGMAATKGQILVELVSDEEKANLRTAQINRAQQKRDLIRIEGLVKARTLPTARLDDQRTLYAKAQADIQVAQSRIRDRQIVAPFDGQLGIRQISLGSLVTPGTVIATLDDLSIIKLDFTIVEGFLASLKEGQTITALTEAYPGHEFIGKVTNIGSRIDPVSRAVSVRALIGNEDRYLRPGMLMRVKLIKNKRQSLMIPEEALVTAAEQKYVFLIQGNGHVKQQPVIIGGRRPGAIEILQGLSLGQKVVTEGTMKLQDNSKVIVKNSDRPKNISQDGIIP